MKIGKGALVGFNAEKSHESSTCASAISCGPSCSRWCSRCGELLDDLLQPRRTAEVQLTLVDQGADVMLKGVPAEGLRAIEAADGVRAGSQALARLSVDQGIGPETLYEPQPATVSLSGTPVSSRSGGFLQATEDGEEALVAAASAKPWGGVSGSRTCSPGLAPSRCDAGTYAAEASRDAAAALKRAAPGMTRRAPRSLSAAAGRARIDSSSMRSCSTRLARALRNKSPARRLSRAAHRLRQLQSRDLRA